MDESTATDDIVIKEFSDWWSGNVDKSIELYQIVSWLPVAGGTSCVICNAKFRDGFQVAHWSGGHLFGSQDCCSSKCALIAKDRMPPPRKRCSCML